MPIHTADFIAPNIMVLRLIEYREELIYLKENWQRIYSVDVISYEIIEHGIDYEKNKEFIKDITLPINVKTLKEALEIANKYNMEHKMK